MTKLIIVWETGEREEHLYQTQDEAERVARGMQMAFGKQLWIGCVEART